MTDRNSEMKIHLGASRDFYRKTIQSGQTANYVVVVVVVAKKYIGVVTDHQ